MSIAHVTPTKSLGEMVQTPLALTAQIAEAYLHANALEIAQLSALLKGIHGTLVELGRNDPVPALVPMVKISQSVHRDYVECLEDGKKFKMLKRHLTETHGMSIEEHRKRWGLPPRYSVVAPAYAESRAILVKKAWYKRRGAFKRGLPSDVP